jgi:transcription elongation factor GreA
MDSDRNTKVASLGSWVKVREAGEDDEEIFHLVDARHADLANNRLHPHNAMARALLGVAPGDEVQMDAPKGLITFSVLDVGRD